MLYEHLRKLHRHRILVNAGSRDPHSSTDKRRFLLSFS
jgi:hypothetical protein